LSERARPRRSGGEILAQNVRPDSARGPDAMARGLGLPPMAPVAAAGAGGLVRASVPLSVAGFSPRTVAELTDELKPTGLVPMQAGGGRRVGPPAAGHVEP